MESTLATMTLPELAKKYDVTEPTLRTWLRKGWLPPRCKMPGQTPFWYVHLIDKWEKDRGICTVTPEERYAHPVLTRNSADAES